MQSSAPRPKRGGPTVSSIRPGAATSLLNASQGGCGYHCRVGSCVLITGMSGTVKSALQEELATRGFPTVDTDYGEWLELIGGQWLWREDHSMPSSARAGPRRYRSSQD